MSNSSKDSETDLLLEKQKKFNERKVEHQRHPSRLEWAEESCIRWVYILTWWWVKRIILLSYKRTLVEDDLDDLPHDDKCSTLLNKVSMNDWKKMSVWAIIFKTFSKEFFLTGVLLIPYIVARIGQPLLMHEIVLSIGRYRADPSVPITSGYLYAVGLFGCVLLQILIQHQYFFRCVRGGVSIRNAFMSFIYKHLLSLNTASLNQITAVQKVNLIAKDLAKFDDFITHFHFLWDAPIEAIVMFVILSWGFGILPIAFGYLVLFTLIGIQIIFNRIESGFLDPLTKWTDRRLKAFGELINGYRVIKMHAWEKTMAERVLERRQDEYTSLRRVSNLRAFNMGLLYATVPVTSLATFGSAWLLGDRLDSMKIFTVITFYAQLRMPVAYFFPRALERLRSIQKIVKEISNLMEMAPISSIKASLSTEEVEMKPQRGSIIMQDASFSWNGYPSILSSININIKPGSFVGITGPLGAGKSSLLAAILGEMNISAGQVQINSSSFSYAAQPPWIVADTLRANILFGNPYDEERYSSVLKACCLDADLIVFGPSGDLIMLGERGINLSGGQRARIVLARALYAEADIYLLDDPLATVDARVAKQIYKRCLGLQGLLNNKTRVLVTHQAQYLVGADQIITLNYGRIQVNDAIDQPPPIYDGVKDQDDLQREDMEMINLLDIIQKSNIDTKSVVSHETTATGNVSFSVWVKFFTAPPLRVPGLGLLILILALGEAIADMSNCWLYHWSAQKKEIQRQSMFPIVYLVLVLTALLLSIARACFAFYHMLCGSNTIHKSMVDAVANSHIQFFESNPSGRILNRAAKDQHVMDEIFPATILDGVQTLLMTTGAAILIIRIYPWILIALVPLVSLCGVLSFFYLKCSRQLKRLESISQSPIYSLFQSSLDGFTTIRAFKVKDDFISLFMNKIDANTRAYITRLAVGHWYGLGLDFLTSLFIITNALLSISFCQIVSPEIVALCLMYAICMIGWFQ